MNDNLKRIYAKLTAMDTALATAIRAPTKAKADDILWEARRDLGAIPCEVSHLYNTLVNPPAPFVCPDPHQAAEEDRIAEQDRRNGRKFRPH